MASQDFNAALPAHAHPMAPSGYGKRYAADEDPCGKGDFGHLPQREAYLAAYIDRLPEGAAIDCKTLAKEQPLYGQAAVRSALNALSEAGHLRWFQERVEGLTQWVTYTYFSRTARDNAWWAWFREGGVRDEEPGAEQPTPRPPARSAAYTALAGVGAADARMMLSAADCGELEALPLPGSGAWWAQVPFRFAAAAALTALLVAVFRSAERPAAARPAPPAARWGGPGAAIGVALALFGVLGLSAVGFGGLLDGHPAVLIAVRITAPAAIAMALGGWALVEGTGRAGRG